MSDMKAEVTDIANITGSDYYQYRYWPSILTMLILKIIGSLA